tara:strand:+ start:371 stop:1396 length:1026 start_codon:yes stop_codon:yes gene_type:complete
VSESDNYKNISSLDFFRGIAGYGVAICHFYYYLYDSNYFQFYSIFFVEFFFVLSGFVLYPQLKRIHENISNTKIFYLRRWYRTIPPYLIALLLYSILFSKFDLDTLKYLFFIQNISESFAEFDYFYVAWSLAIEEFFYLIFPICLILLNKKKFINITLLFISLIYCVKILYLIFDVNEEFYRIGTFLRLDSIAFGVIIRIFFEKIKNNFLNFTLILLISFSMIYFEKNLVNLKNFELFGFVLLIQLISVNIIIIFINFDRIIPGKFLKKFFSLLSKQTYSIYLFHFAFIYLIEVNNFFINTQWIFFFYFTCLFLFSTLFYYVFEKVIIENRPTYNNKISYS